MADADVVAFPKGSGYRGGMKTTALEVRIRPADGPIELRRLTMTLDQVRLALTDIDRAYFVRGSRPKWVVTELHYHMIDLVVRVTAPSTQKRPAASMLVSADALVAGIESLRREPAVPDYYSERTVERILDISAPGHGIRELSVATINGETGPLVPVSDPVRENARRAVIGTQESLGSVAGWLDSMNARRLSKHGLTVGIYDPLRRRAVAGQISADMADEAHDKFWRKRVLASGRITRNERGQPVRIKIDYLELLPEDDTERASVDDLLGADEGWLQGQAVDDYLGEARRA